MFRAERSSAVHLQPLKPVLSGTLGLELTRDPRPFRHSFALRCRQGFAHGGSFAGRAAFGSAEGFGYGGFFAGGSLLWACGPLLFRCGFLSPIFRHPIFSFTLRQTVKLKVLCRHKAKLKF
jgi:hypothetical protein